MINPEYIGFLAAVLTTSAFLPQAYKIWKSRTTDGLSLTMYGVMGSGTLCWLIYGVLIASPSVIGANTISISIITFILIFIIRTKK